MCTRSCGAPKGRRWLRSPSSRRPSRRSGVRRHDGGCALGVQRAGAASAGDAGVCRRVGAVPRRWRRAGKAPSTGSGTDSAAATPCSSGSQAFRGGPWLDRLCGCHHRQCEFQVLRGRGRHGQAFHRVLRGGVWGQRHGGGPRPGPRRLVHRGVRCLLCGRAGPLEGTLAEVRRACQAARSGRNCVSEEGGHRRSADREFLLRRRRGDGQWPDARSFFFGAGHVAGPGPFGLWRPRQ